MEPLVVWSVALVATAIGFGINRLIQGPELKPPPRVSIAEAKDGVFVAVVGRVVSGATLQGPVTGRPCVAYDAAHYHGLGGGRQMWMTGRRLRGAPFVIDDGTGTALVDPRGAFVRIPCDHRRVAGVADQLKLHDPTFTTEGSGCERAVDEGVIALGAVVMVHAVVRTDAGAADDSLYRAADPVGLQLVGSPKRSAVVSTMPADLPARRDL